ncbi:MAG: Fic family protein [Candidatus Dormiibacterota bacterium]
MKRNTPRRGRPSRQLVYQRLQEAMTELHQRMGGLPSPTEAEGIWTSIWYQEAHHSTALEGNTLVIKQVETLLGDGLAVGNKELSQYLEVTGYAAAAQWVYGHALNSGGWAAGTTLTLTEIRHVHELALGPVWGVAPHPNARPGERPGSFREHDIEPFRSGMVPPSWVRVQAAVTDWTASLPAALSSANPVESLAAAHGAFERIHPFLDGNGRTGRLLLNLLLVRSGYPPAVVYTRDRNRYLKALRRADVGDPGPLGELIARAVTDNLYRFVVLAVAGPDRLVPLASLASREHSLVSLRVALERGRLKGQRSPDGQWRSTRSWLADYLASRYRRSS